MTVNTNGGQTTGAGANAAAEQKDVSLIKATFKDNEALLLQVRALMYGIDLLQDEKEHVKNVFSNPALRDLMQRRFLPDIMQSRNHPLGQIQDIWLGAEQMVFGASAIQIEQAMKYKAKAEEFTRHALTLLVSPDGMKVPFGILPFEQDSLQIDLMARNMYLRHIDQQLMMLNIIANQEEKASAPEKPITPGRNLRNG